MDSFEDLLTSIFFYTTLAFGGLSKQLAEFILSEKNMFSDLSGVRSDMLNPNYKNFAFCHNVQETMPFPRKTD